MSDELVIDQSNFNSYFFDVRRHKPKSGQILARFRAIAIFGSGPHKLDVIRLLQKDKASEAAQVMNRIHMAKVPDCYKICRQICEDLLNGMTEEDVEKKEYEYEFEALFYTNREYVPAQDPHWETLTVIEFDPETNTFRSNITI